MTSATLPTTPPATTAASPAAVPRSATGLVFNSQPRRNFWFDEESEPARSVIDERRHRQQRLANTFRLFARHGFDVGLAGHVTARDPELADHFWVNPLGLHFTWPRRITAG